MHVTLSRDRMSQKLPHPHVLLLRKRPIRPSRSDHSSESVSHTQFLESQDICKVWQDIENMQ